MEDEFTGEGSAAQIQAIARATIAKLPEEFRSKLDPVVIRVAEFASSEQLLSVDIGCKWDLTGLYEGRPIDEQSLWDTGDLPPMITLFRQPLIREWQETGVDFEALIRHVTIHEAGHHFGLSDEAMHWLEESADRE